MCTVDCGFGLQHLASSFSLYSRQNTRTPVIPHAIVAYASPEGSVIRSIQN
jgi:hypothetical protein